MIGKLAAGFMLVPLVAAQAQDKSSNLVRSFWNGNTMYEACSKTEPTTSQGEINGTACRMYVVGIVDAVYASAAIRKTACQFDLPPGTTMLQVQDVVAKHLREHAEHRHVSGYYQVVTALKAAFPCR